MVDEPEAPASNSQDSEPASGDERSAAKDLADGLDLMLRAAKKAVRHVDPQNIESIGRKALDNLEALNKKRVAELKSKARRSLDPRRIEEIAEDAGKELIRVVERVAERVDSIVNRSHGGAEAEPTTSTEPKDAPATEPSGGSGDAEKRVRVSED